MLANRPAVVDAPLASRLSGADLPKRLRARRTNDPFADLNLNTALARRIADLARSYLAALGNPIDIERQAAAVGAAELAVLAEQARAVALKQGAAADLDMVVRVQGAADRALRRLGIKPTAAAKPSLAEHLASRAAKPVAAPTSPAATSPPSPEDASAAFPEEAA